MQHRDRNLETIAPAAARNRQVICDVLQDILPAKGLILEVGSGTGAHATLFAQRFSHLTFQPTDRTGQFFPDIEDWANQLGLKNLNKPLIFDLLSSPSPVETAQAMIAINVLHIAPWEATLNLLRHASSILPPHSPLVFYGPFHRSDLETVASNCDFDARLKADDPAQGLRHLDDITTHALDQGFSAPTITPMPANNLIIVFRKKQIMP